MKLPILLASAFALLMASPAAAQVDVSVTNSVDATSTIDLSIEGLGDDDLDSNLEAEALPTTNGVSYFFERIRDQVVTTFTFNAERKAERYRIRLHNLDRKLTACAEIGDTVCGDQIEERIAILTDRAEEHIAKRQELAEAWQERFEAWREQREARVQSLRAKAQERRAQSQQLVKERRAKRQDARSARRTDRQEARQLRQQNRQESRLERQELRQDARTDRQETRQQNREDRAADRANRLETQILRPDADGSNTPTDTTADPTE